MHPDHEIAYRRRKRLWIIMGIIVGLIVVAIGLGSLGMGLVYNSIRPQAPPPKTTPVQVPTQTEITIRADGTYLWDGTPVRETDSTSGQVSLKKQIQKKVEEDVWKLHTFSIKGEENTETALLMDVIQWIQESGGQWEMSIIE